MGGLESGPTSSTNTNASEYRKNFGTALTMLIKKRGYRNINRFRTDIEQGTNKSKTQVYEWTRGEIIPTAESMSMILITLKPEGDELDQLINPWGRALETELTGIGGPKSGSESALRGAKAIRKESKNPLGKWFDTTADDLRITLKELSARLGIPYHLFIPWRKKGIPTLEHISFLLERAQERLDLSKEQEESFRDAIAKTIEEAYKRDEEIGSAAPNSLVRIVQRQTTRCVTYTGGQARKELGITSREGVRQLRRDVGISNTLLTEADIKRMKEYRSLSRREKREFREQVRSS